MKLKIMILSILITILVLIHIIFNTYNEFKPIEYIDRQTSLIKTEKVVGEKWLKFLYYSPYGEIATNTLIRNKFLSVYYGNKMNNENSKKNIYEFVKKYNIDISQNLLSIDKYKNFNEFFYRKLKKDARNIDYNKNTLVSPVDGKVLVYDLIKKDNIFVKGIEFNLQKFLGDEELSKKYENGTILIFRLAPTDYHRFHFPLDGLITNTTKIKGKYYSVSPHALRKNLKIFMENKREYSILKTKGFGDVILAEVGATMVGSIVQTYKENSFVHKGDEKGYFKFGGSTCILIFEENKINVDKDIINNSKNNLETKIFMGEKIATKY